jgi:hypothetical protein
LKCPSLSFRDIEVDNYAHNNSHAE